MKFYGQLALLGAFTYKEAAKIIKNSNPMKTLDLFLKCGYIRKVKRNLYVCVDLATGADLADRFRIASKINDDSFVSCHSAFEFYGFYNQVYFTNQVSSYRRFSNFEYDGMQFESLISNESKQIDYLKGVRVTSLERTIVDSINTLGKTMDVEELLKCLELIPSLEEEKIKEMLLTYNKDSLYRKAGYILSYFKNDFGLSEEFFVFCKEHSKSKNIVKISNHEINKLQYISEWNILAYKELLRLLYK